MSKRRGDHEDDLWDRDRQRARRDEEEEARRYAEERADMFRQLLAVMKAMRAKGMPDDVIKRILLYHDFPINVIRRSFEMLNRF